MIVSNKNKVVRIRITDYEYQKLKKIVHDSFGNVSMSDVLRSAIYNYTQAIPQNLRLHGEQLQLDKD